MENRIETYLGDELFYTTHFSKTQTQYMGRSNKCDIKFNYNFLSEEEIKFFIREKNLYIEVLGYNAVHLNRQKLLRNKRKQLFKGDVIKKGKFKFLIN